MLEGDVFLVVFGFLLAFITMVASTLFIFTKSKRVAARRALERTTSKEDFILEAQLRENEKILKESLEKYEESRNKIELDYLGSKKDFEEKVENHRTRFIAEFEKDPVKALKESAERLGMRYVELNDLIDKKKENHEQ